jgi:hypothetical protein
MLGSVALINKIVLRSDWYLHGSIIYITVCQEKGQIIKTLICVLVINHQSPQQVGVTGGEVQDDRAALGEDLR